ncbi:MAG: low specificity L-threonine aldolase [Gammaproteobacteria bacterium]|nr:low specificity L-threonine aldolase [Gammaproteobacteria bacterium]
MVRFFKSDNTAPIAPQILAAIASANDDFAQGYGEDNWSLQLDGRFSKLFERDVRVFPVSTGTAANSLAIATLVPPYGAVLTHQESHMVRDECGAPEFMSGGARLILIEGLQAKITPLALSAALKSNPTSVHTVQPRALSITQATELGTVYQPEEIYQLCSIAHENSLIVHMDGARFANAIAYLGCSPAEVTWKAGVDVMSFGATKNGALSAEAVIFFDTTRISDFEFRRKRSAHLLSKMRFVSAQLLAYLDNDLWLKLAKRANSLAQRLGTAAGSLLMHPVQANEVFVKIGITGAKTLRTANFEFYDWGSADSGEARLVVSWNQPTEDIDHLCEVLQRLSS